MSLARSQKSMGREHRERDQPAARKRLGLLEKKSDWLQRTRAFQKKSKKLKKLRKNALERNRDEFNFHMINSRVGIDGVHREAEALDEEQTETQRVLDDVRDINYVRHKLSAERKKIEKLKSTLHLTDMSDRPNKRTIFVDSIEEAQNFDLKKQPTTSSSTFKVNVTKHEALEIEKLRHAQYAELNQRLGREKELSIVLQKLELKKELAVSKGRSKPKLIEKGTKDKPAVFKWKYERKK